MDELGSESEDTGSLPQRAFGFSEGYRMSKLENAALTAALLTVALVVAVGIFWKSLNESQKEIE